MNRRDLLALPIATVALPARARNPKLRRVSGIYSDLSRSPQSGDLGGMELLIVPLVSDSYTAFVQLAEGGAAATALVPFTLKGTKFELQLPTDGVFSGEHLSVRFVGADLIVRWSDGREHRLKRGRSYWQ